MLNIKPLFHIMENEHESGGNDIEYEEYGGEHEEYGGERTVTCFLTFSVFPARFQMFT